MSAKRIDMHRLQEVIRLHRLGHSRRQICLQLRMGRNTLRQYQERLESAGLLEGTADDLPDLEELGEVIGLKSPAPPPQSKSSIEPWRDRIKKLHKEGCGPTAIHDSLRLKEPDYTGHLSSVKRLTSA